DFSKTMNDYFAAEIDAIDVYDPSSAKRINDWVNNETNGLIDEIVESPLPEDLLAYIINALYFNGTWQYAFNKDQTFDELFFTENGEIELPFMILHEELAYFETDTLQAVKLPYGDGKMNMQVFLPRDNVAVDELVNELSEATWKKWQEVFRVREGNIHVDQLRLHYEDILTGTLQLFGINEAFTDHADFTKINPQEADDYLSEGKQKAFIEVDEEGTEAAAVTSAEMRLPSTSE